MLGGILFLVSNFCLLFLGVSFMVFYVLEVWIVLGIVFVCCYCKCVFVDRLDW